MSCFSQNSHFSSPIHVLMKAKKPKSLIGSHSHEKAFDWALGVMTVEQRPYHVAPLCPLLSFAVVTSFSLRMPQRMTPTAGYAMMGEMFSAVISVQECSTFSALASLGHQREMKSGTVLFVR